MITRKVALICVTPKLRVIGHSTWHTYFHLFPLRVRFLVFVCCAPSHVTASEKSRQENQVHLTCCLPRGELRDRGATWPKCYLISIELRALGCHFRACL